MPVVGKATARVAGQRQMVIEGRVYDDRDPLVLQRPEMFESLEDHQRRKARPRSTADLGMRSMSSRRTAVETATADPGEKRDLAHECPKCDYVATSDHGLRIHKSRVHGR